MAYSMEDESSGNRTLSRPTRGIPPKSKRLGYTEEVLSYATSQSQRALRVAQCELEVAQRKLEVVKRKAEPGSYRSKEFERSSSPIMMKEVRDDCEQMSNKTTKSDASANSSYVSTVEPAPGHSGRTSTAGDRGDIVGEVDRQAPPAQTNVADVHYSEYTYMYMHGSTSTSGTADRCNGGVGVGRAGSDGDRLGTGCTEPESAQHKQPVHTTQTTTADAQEVQPDVEATDKHTPMYGEVYTPAPPVLNVNGHATSASVRGSGSGSTRTRDQERRNS